MKYAGWLYFFSLPILAALIFMRPSLVNFSRFKTEFPPWNKPDSSAETEPSVISTATFPSRLSPTWETPGEDNFFRGNLVRGGATPHSVPLKLKLDWRYSNLNIGIHGASKATPAVDSTGIYIGGDSAWFFAFNLDGRPRWKLHISDAQRGFHSTAFLHAGRVCVGGYNGTFYCLDKKNGEVVWTLNVSRGGFGASPLILDDDFFAAVETSHPLNSFMIKADMRSGQIAWQSDWLGEQSHSSPAFNPKTGSFYLGANNNLFFKINRNNGVIDWRVDLGGPVKDTPLIGNECVLTTSWARKLFCVDATDGHTIWETQLQGKSQSSPTYIPGSGVVIVGDSGGGLTGVNARSGKVLWIRKTDLIVQSSALAARLPGSELWVAWMACGKTKLCALNPATGKSLVEYELPGMLTGVPVAYEGALYLALNYPGGLLKLSGPSSN